MFFCFCQNECHVFVLICECVLRDGFYEFMSFRVEFMSFMLVFEKPRSKHMVVFAENIEETVALCIFYAFFLK